MSCGTDYEMRKLHDSSPSRSEDLGTEPQQFKKIVVTTIYREECLLCDNDRSSDERAVWRAIAVFEVWLSRHHMSHVEHRLKLLVSISWSERLP